MVQLPVNLRAWSDGQALTTTAGIPVDVAPFLLFPGDVGAVIVAPRAGIVKNLFARVQQAPGAGQTITFTLMVDSIAKPLSVVISGAALQASDTFHQVPVAKGAKLEIQRTLSQAANLPQAMRVETEFA